MSRFTFPKLALVATVTAVSVACGDAGSGLDVGAASTATQAVISTYAPQLDQAVINEGESVTVSSLLCVDNNVTNVTVSVVDWQDGSTPVAADSLVRPAATFVQNTATCPGTGNFEVCGPATNSCQFTHTFADDFDNASRNVQTRAVQGGDIRNQGLALTVNNLPPSIDAVNRAGGINEGSIQAITVTVSDPGTLANEIRSLTVNIAPPASLANAFPSRIITCTCNGIGFVCDDADGTTTSICRGTVNLRSRWLDNGNFTVTAVVTDKELPPETPLSDTASTAPLAVANVPPTLSATIVRDDLDLGDTNALTGTVVSGSVVNPLGVTTVVEGFNYRLDFSFNDVGTDTLSWDWNFANGQRIGPRAPLVGSGTVGRPTDIVDPLSLTADPAALRDTFAWDQAFAPNTFLVVEVSDDDLGDADATHAVTVVDVNPINTAVTDSLASATVDEGTIATFTVNTRSGDFGSGFDPIRTNGYTWDIRVDGTFLNITNLAPSSDVIVSGNRRVRIVSGCSSTGVTTDAGATGSNTCQVNFIDGDTAFESNDYIIRATVQDEDSAAQALSRTITVRNVQPDITVFNVTRRPSTGGADVVIGSLPTPNSTSAGSGSVQEADQVLVDVTFTDPADSLDGNFSLSTRFFIVTAQSGEVEEVPGRVINTAPVRGSPGAFAQRIRLFPDNKHCGNSPGTSGTCTITVQVCEGDSGNACNDNGPRPTDASAVSFTLTVNNVAPTATAAAPTTNPGGALLLVEGQAYNLNGSLDDRAGAFDDDFSATWSYTDGPGGDGSSANRTTTRSDVPFADRATGATTAGDVFVNVPVGGLINQSFSLTITDGDGQTGAASTTNATIRDNRPTVRILRADLINANDNNTADVRENASRGRVVLQLAPETSADLLTSLTVNWGDGTTSNLTGVATPGVNQFNQNGESELTVLKPARYADNCQSTVHNCDVNGNYIVTVTVSDEDSTDRRNTITNNNEARVVCSGGQPFSAACQETTLGVQNQNPIVFASTPSVASTIVVAEGQAATIVITADDIAGADIIGIGGNVMEFEFDWGDGTIDTLSGTQTAGGQDFGPPGNIQDNFTRVGRGAHIYSSPGLFDVTVTITDKDGGVFVATYEVDVINVAPVLTDLFATLPTFEGVELSSLAVVENRGADTLDYTFSTTRDLCNPGNGVTDADFAVARPAFTVPPTLGRAQQTSGVFKTTFPDQATETICVRVCDDDVQANSCVFGSVNVVVRNVDPVITAFAGAVVGGGLLTEGGSVDFTTSATDVAADPLTISVNCGNGTTRTGATARCAYPTSGAFTATTTVTDGDGGSAITTAQVAVANVAPNINLVSAVTVTQGQTATLALRAVDVGGDPVNFQFSNGLITSTVASGATLNQQVTVPTTTTLTVRACDIEGACSAPTNALITVTNAVPVISSLVAPSLVREGTAFTVVAQATDAGNDALTFEFDFANLGGNVPAGAPNNPPASASNAITVTLTEAGRIAVTVIVRDGNGGQATQTALFDVEDVPGRIVAFDANNNRINEGGSVTLTAVGDDPASLIDTFTFAFDCDGNGSFETGDADPTGGNGAATCTFGDNGTFAVSVRATDGAVPPNVDERSLVIVVDNVAPNAVTLVRNPAAGDINEGGSVAFTATAGDVTADLPLTFEFDLNGDGVIDNRNTTGLSTFTYGDNASVNATVRACDKNGACSQLATPVAVNVVNVRPAIAANGIIFPASIPVGSPFTATVQATDVPADTLSYSFNFSGANALANVSTGATPSVTQIFPNAGTTTFTVTVTDKDGGTVTSGTQSFTIENEAPRITTFTQTPIVLNEGGSTALAASASDRGGGTLTFTFDCGGGARSNEAAQTASCTFAQSGTNLVTVTVSDGSLSDTRTATVVVNNVAPAVPVLTAPATVNQAATATLSATSTDVAGDTVRIEFDFNGDNLIDATAASGATVTTSFARAGTANVKARACDNEGACSAFSGVSSIAVNNVAPVIAAVTSPASSIVGAPVTVSVTASDAGNDPLEYIFDIVGPSPSTVTQTSPVLVTSFADSGSYTITVTAREVGPGLSSTPVARDLVVTDINTNLVGLASPATLNEGQATTLSVTPTNGIGPFVARFDTNADGDFEDTYINNAGAPVEEDGGLTPVTCALNAACITSVRYDQNRAGNLDFRVLVSVTDTGNNGVITTAIISVSVTNVAPTVDAGADASQSEVVAGANPTILPFSRQVAVTDPGRPAAAPNPDNRDTLAFALVNAPTGMTVSSTGLISFTPSFRDAGTHNVTVRVTDSDGAQGTDEFVLTVTIIDANNNGISDTQERALNGGNLLAANAGTTDTDADGVSDRDEVLGGTNPAVSDAPRPPTIISPNGVTVNTATPVLTVANAISPRARTLTYTFVIENGDGEVGRIENVASGETTTSVTVPSTIVLDEETTYTWFAFAEDGLRNLTNTADIPGVPSDDGTFTVNAVNAAPGAPNALSPSNTASFLDGTIVTLEARASADPDGDAVSYTFQVASDAAFATIIQTSEARDVQVFTIPEPLAVGTYHWRARASDGALTSAFGTPGTFEIEAIVVNAAPGSPGISAPTNTTLTANTATLTITAAVDSNGDALTYEFEHATNAAFANATVSGLQAGLTFAVANLAEDTQHFWRARAFDGELYSDWANATFVVDAVNGAPTGLALLSPANGALLLAAPTAFTATEAIDPEGDDLTYTVVVSAAEDFSAPLVNATATVTNGVVSLAAPALVATDLELGETYFWRVTASDGTVANDIVASASFSLFLPPEDGPSVGGGGCQCSSTDDNGAVGVIGAAMGLLALRRRRRR